MKSFESILKNPQILSKNLLQWYSAAQRDLPWRKTIDPYKIWVSEVMLQQTQVERVKSFYKKFLEHFPTVESLAEASWEELMECWRGLGYYRRARNMHAAAQVIVNDYAGVFPKTYADMLPLPGFGRYTAAAVASFAYSERVPAIDTNFHKVFIHVFGRDLWHSLKPLQQFEYAQQFLPKDGPAEFNHAIMDLGASGILDKPDRHNECPFTGFCQGAEEYALRERPVRSIFRDRETPSFRTFLGTRVAIGVLIHQGKVLIARRRKDDSFGGLWEFPGGKAHDNENERTCLKREMKEELDIEVAVRPAFYVTEAKIGERTLLLSFHRCSLLLGNPKPLAADELQWVSPEELLNYRFPPSNDEVIKLLLSKKAMFYQ